MFSEIYKRASRQFMSGLYVYTTGYPHTYAQLVVSAFRLLAKHVFRHRLIFYGFGLKCIKTVLL
jgi:hypothetical protein